MVKITVKVVVQSGRQSVGWDCKQQLLKCYLKSAPEKNRANEELVALLAERLGIAKSLFAIVGGATARRKTLAITAGLTLQDIYSRLGVQDVADMHQQTIS